MGLITQKALANDTFRSIVAKPSYLKPATNKQPEAEIKQFNYLLRPGKFYYSKAIGVKTGYHSKALRTLIGAATYEGRTLLVVLLGCKQKEDRYLDAKKLFEAAFAEQKVHRVYFDEKTAYQREIEGAKTLLKAALAQNLALEFFPSEEPEVKAYIHWEQSTLPIRKGTSVGELRLVNESGAILNSLPLLAQEDVKPTFWFALKRKLSR
jgi:D-alanyl-D-alanine carboxypeptidase (penicillin-binding protein 5/6)